MPFIASKQQIMPDLKVYSDKLEQPLGNEVGYNYEPTFVEAFGRASFYRNFGRINICKPNKNQRFV